MEFIPLTSPAIVLIESDWNLKNAEEAPIVKKIFGINRIRLEFKGSRISYLNAPKRSINRIRLEFKVNDVIDVIF